MKRSKKKSSVSENLDSVCSGPTEGTKAGTVGDNSMSAEMMCQLYEGQLSKYTNVMKGWQYRWFILDPKSGILSYYLNENERKQQQPRGWVHLEASVISPSDEDSNTFSVNSSSGESFKLRAQDARARQEWVNRLRAVSLLHVSTGTPQINPSLPPREHSGALNKAGCINSSSSLALWDAFSAVREHLFRAEQSNFLLIRTVDDLPTTGDLKNVDPDLLILKASSQAMLTALNQCLFILHQQSQDLFSSSKKGSKHDHASHSKKKFTH